MPSFIEFSDAVVALLTAWLEVRVLPGPPLNIINTLDGILATVATVFGDSKIIGISAVIFDRWSAAERREFGSLRARQILTIHRYKWQAKRYAMQNGLICMASTWHGRRFTTDSEIASRRFEPLLLPRAERSSDRAHRWLRAPSARSIRRNRERHR
jgi:hypothetical protein